jgi:hypothetical protein
MPQPLARRVAIFLPSFLSLVAKLTFWEIALRHFLYSAAARRLSMAAATIVAWISVSG